MLTSQELEWAKKKRKEKKEINKQNLRLSRCSIFHVR